MCTTAWDTKFKVSLDTLPIKSMLKPARRLVISHFIPIAEINDVHRKVAKESGRRARSCITAA